MERGERTKFFPLSFLEILQEYSERLTVVYSVSQITNLSKERGKGRFK
jgi:hypothetical protein